MYEGLWLKRIGSLVFLLAATIALAACRSETPGDVATSAGDSVNADGKVNLNNMTRDQLIETIPDFGSRMVREFFEYQPYVSIQQFRREIGKYVDDVQVTGYEQYVFVPVDVDGSDAETLMQIPGVDTAIASRLMDGRPYGSNDGFLDKLGELISAEQLAVATSYLTE